MQVITLYRYERTDGSITISPVAPELGINYTTKVRLIADEGKVLTKDDSIVIVVDTDSELSWEEIDEPKEPEELNPELDN